MQAFTLVISSKTASVIPPACQLISREEGIRLLKPGQITSAIIAQTETNEPGQIISAGIGMAKPKDKTQHGFLIEVEQAIGRTPEDVEQDVIEMSIENLVTQWDKTFDGEKVFRKGKKNYKIGDQQILVDSFVQTAKGAEQNKWTVAVVLAVFIYDN